MHLPIRVVGRSQPVEVPFQLLSSFCFAVHVPGHGVQEFVADLSSHHVMMATVRSVEWRGIPDDVANEVASEWALAAHAAAQSILSAILSRLGLMDMDGQRQAFIGADALTWIGLAHQAEKRTSEACKAALVHLTPVWRDRTEPPPKVHVAADILDSYYQQAMDEVIGNWEAKAQREASDYLTGRTVGGNSEVAP